MKRFERIIFLCGILALFNIIALLSSCDLFGTSISARVAKLENDLNGPLGRDISGNFHSDVSSSVVGEGVLTGTVLDISRTPFTIQLIGSATGSGDKFQNGDLTVNSPLATYAINFQFREDGTGNWTIYSMTAGGQTWP